MLRAGSLAEATLVTLQSRLAPTAEVSRIKESQITGAQADTDLRDHQIIPFSNFFQGCRIR